MKHRTLRCAAETLVLLLIAVMAVFLAAGLHQREPDGSLSTLSTGWYQLTDGVRREVTLPAALETGPGQTITLYNDTLTDSDGGKVLSARGVEYGIEIRAGETLLYRYEDNAFPKNAQMKGRLWADTELPYGIGGQTLSLTLTELPGRMCRIDAPVLGSMPAVTGRHIQSSLFSAGMILVMLVLAVLALLIFFYTSFFGIRERRFLDTAVFLLLCSLWCLTDSGLYQLYGADTAAGSVVSFYAFMTMAIPMVHFVRNTVSGRLRLVPDVLIALLCANALAQGAAYRLFGVPFIDMLPLTHLLLTAGVAAMLTVLFRSYRAQPAPQLRLRIAAFAALGAFGVAALVLYWLLHIYWYDAVYQFGVLLFIILLLHGLISQAAEDQMPPSSTPRSGKQTSISGRSRSSQRWYGHGMAQNMPQAIKKAVVSRFTRALPPYTEYSCHRRSPPRYRSRPPGLFRYRPAPCGRPRCTHRSGLRRKR